MRLHVAVLAVTFSVLGVEAGAQAAPDQGIQPIASARVRAELWDWFQTPDADASYAYIGSLFRFGARQDLDRFMWTAEAAVPVLLGLPDDAQAPAPQGALGLGANYRAAIGSQNGVSIFVKQVFVSVKLQPELVLRAGRFEFSDGLEGPIPDGPLGAL
ncbi:MAG TPA: hypothetical protein VK864_20245, partial [Longimicrobiales bacterium]|nr:hypothetical protein [Longimicrobiales bacterium]